MRKFYFIKSPWWNLTENLNLRKNSDFLEQIASYYLQKLVKFQITICHLEAKKSTLKGIIYDFVIFDYSKKSVKWNGFYHHKLHWTLATSRPLLRKSSCSIFGKCEKKLLAFHILFVQFSVRSTFGMVGALEPVHLHKI